MNSFDIKQHNDYIKILQFQRKNHSLRIPTSQIAALTGFHPYADIPQIVLALVYQGSQGQLLLQRDLNILGLTLVDEDLILNEIATRAGQSTQKLLQKAISVKHDTIQSASNIKEKVVSLAKQSKQLSKKEIEFLKQAVRQKVDTQFGTLHEEDALDIYQKQIGWDVYSRNEEIMEWKFEKNNSNSLLQPIGIARPLHLKMTRTNENKDSINMNMNPANKVDLCKKRKREDQKENVTVDTSTKQNQNLSEESYSYPLDNASINKPSQVHESNESQKEINNSNPKAYFSILGSIDGIRDEYWCDPHTTSLSQEKDEFNNTNDGEWKIRQIIIECKHRMNRFYDPPPLYDQIQAAVYCLMYKVQQADIVQVLRKKKECKENNEGSVEVIDIDEGAEKYLHRKESIHNILSSDAKESFIGTDFKKVIKKKARPKIEIKVHRVSLDDPIFHHAQNFQNEVLPRLQSMVATIYSLRSDDNKRYRFLLGAVGASNSLYKSSKNKNNDNVEKTRPTEKVYFVDDEDECQNRRDDFDSWCVLFDACSWLKNCDISYYRDNF